VIALDFRNVTISYNGTLSEDAAICDLSLSIEKGKIMGIAGESGSGKSTLAKALLNILPNYAGVSGEIFYMGRDILKMSCKERNALRGKEISMIFQDPATALNPVRKIRRQFYDILKSYGEKKAAMDSRIEMELMGVQLPQPRRIMEQYPSQLSGGMQQRVILAAAICNRPKILVADEPTSALDASIRPLIVEELLRIKRENNLTMLYISHNIVELASICDSILILKNGRKIEYGFAEQVLCRPKAQYTRELVEAAMNSTYK